MKLLVLLLLSLSTFNVIPTTKADIQPRAESNDFLVQLILSISESNVPSYLVDLIYDRPTEKGVSSQDVFNLFQVNNLTLNSTLDLLQGFNVTPSTVFSLDSLNHTLEALNRTFPSFYSILTTNLGLTGLPLRDALVALQIDVASFSSGITYGDPDPWSEFIKGNFTQETIAQASAVAGITVETLFGGLRNFIANEMVTLPVNDFVKELLNHSIGKHEAVLIWNALNFTIQDVYNVEHFRDIFGNLSEKISNQTSLGVLTSENSIQIHRNSYNLFANDREIVNITAEALLAGILLTVNEINDTAYSNIVVLKHNESSLGLTNLTTVEIGHVDHNLTDCSYVTVQNKVVESVNVTEAYYVDHTFVIPRNVTNNVVLGSALVCNNTVFGLVREADNETIILDIFESVAPLTPQTPVSGASSHIVGCLNVSMLIVMITYVFGH